MDVSGLIQAENGGRAISAWLPFSDEVEVHIGYLKREELRAINKESTKTSFVNHQPVPDFDATKADVKTGKKAVLGWRARKNDKGEQVNPDIPETGFHNNGAEFPCNADNIEIMMKGWNGFSAFVNQSCIDLDLLVQAQKENVVKNFDPSGKQKQTTPK